jgi:hypothetical protein
MAQQAGSGSRLGSEPSSALLADLRERYRIPAANVIGHSDVAPRRKTDPSHFFPWQRLAGQGFGLWCAAPDDAAPPYAPTALLLRAIGYNTTDLPAAVLAFRRHYFANPSFIATDAEMDADELRKQIIIERKATQRFHRRLQQLEGPWIAKVEGARAELRLYLQWHYKRPRTEIEVRSFGCRRSLSSSFTMTSYCLPSRLKRVT